MLLACRLQSRAAARQPPLRFPFAYRFVARWVHTLAQRKRGGRAEPYRLQSRAKRCEAVIGRITAATVGIINADTPNPNALAYGSGVVVSEDGLVLTAAHVVGKANSPLIILFADGRRAAAVALGADRARDAAMARITEKGKWPFVEMGHSAAMKPGDWCLAMGHPGGVEEGRTPPLRLGRILGAIAGTGLGGYIFSDTTIISGDSGGPLFDLDGKVIGIHSSISGLVTQNNHVPVDTYRELWKDLLAGKQTGSKPQPPAAVPGGIPFGAEDARALGERFHRLLQQRLQAGDPEAKTMISKGQIQVGVDKARELIAKWEAAEAANAKLDMLAFQRRLEERLLAGDHDVLSQVKDGKLLLSPGQMVALDKQWELDEFPRIAAADGIDLQQFHRTLLDRALSGDAEAAAMFRTGGKIGTLPEIKEMLAKWAKQPLPSNSGLTPADLDEFLKHAKFQLDGRIDLNFPGRLQGRFMPLLVQLGLVPTGAELQSGKAQPEVLSAVASVVAGVSPSVVQVLCDGRQVGLGTVVRNDGYIVAKASELSGKITCQIGSRELPAKIVKSNDFDMALLKVEADNLTPVVWSDDPSPPVGARIVTPGAGGKPLALGITSIAARPIPKGPRMILRNAAALGVQLDNRADGATKLNGVAPGSPAEKAGLKAGDIIAALERQAGCQLRRAARGTRQIRGRRQSDSGHHSRRPEKAGEKADRRHPGGRFAVRLPAGGKRLARTGCPQLDRRFGEPAEQQLPAGPDARRGDPGLAMRRADRRPR